ncbi:MAG: hypothetical protein E7395_00880 [Ruminococcaceae bacterium]|nr:hypothetical protein [Oscillospiraceae bacterium]
MMKSFCKTIALLLTFALLFTTSFQALANPSYLHTNYADVQTSSIAASYLDMMGIIDECDKSAPVTRGYAVSTIVRAMGLEKVAQSGNSIYTDEEKMAAVAHRVGILSGSTPSQWSLESPVTYEQLCKMFVVALGYGNIITGDNAFPALYVSQASKLGINRYLTVVNSSDVNFNDFCLMMYQAMQATVLEIVGVYNDNLTYSKSEDRTLESVFLDTHNLSKKVGIVDGDYYASSNAACICTLSQICIDGIYYSCDSAECKDLVGMCVEFVYNNSTALNSRKIVGIRAYEDNRVFTFNRNSDVEYENGKLLYYESDHAQKSIRLSDGLILIYNNQLCSSYSFDEFNLSASHLKLVDNNNDNIYDVMFVTESESVIVSHVRCNNFTIN